MRLSIFILKIFRIEQRTMYFSVYLINVGNGTFLIRTMTFSKYCWNSDHGGHLHLPHPRRQGRVPDLLLGHVTAQLHAPELDHPHKCCQGVTSSQRGGHCDIPALENNIIVSGTTADIYLVGKITSKYGKNSIDVLASPEVQYWGWKPSCWTNAIWALVDTLTTASWSRSCNQTNSDAVILGSSSCGSNSRVCVVCTLFLLSNCQQNRRIFADDILDWWHSVKLGFTV